MSTTSADRNLLFGVLAVQLDFVSRDDLISATSEWMHNKEQPLSSLFVAQGKINDEESRLIESVVQKHLARNNDDPRQSLESIEAFEAIRSTLGELPDTEIRKSLETEYETIAAPSSDPYSTQMAPGLELAGHSSRFSILRLHQRGGLGRVSIALDEELSREIALKEILPAHADNEENRTRFVREAEITGALEHPGVVPVYSLGQFADGRPYYAMRFIRGMNLQMAIEDFYRQADGSAESQLRFRGLVAKIIHTCQTIEYAHSRGVIHRDIKPGNIMLGDYGETLVVDWGLAKTLDEEAFSTDVSTAPPVQASKRASSTSTQVGRVVGTPSYMSPEQAAGRLDALGPTSDIYSLGATLYQLLTGKIAFRGTEEEVLGNVQLGRFAKPREVNPKAPKALEAICLKAMARLSEDRYQSARDMADDLERYMADEQVRAYSEPLLAKAWRWTRNHKAVVISSAAALAVAVTVLTIGMILVTAAYDREHKQRNRAEENFSIATEQRNLAERNFKLARNAVQDYFVTISEETLLKQHGMQDLRKTLLQQALDYYQEFLDQRGEDPTLKREVAEAHYLAGKITQTIDSPERAMDHFLAAADLQKQLFEENPQSQGLIAELGNTLNAIGEAHIRKFDLEAALEQFDASSKLRATLAEVKPDDTEAARTLANSYMNIGTVYKYQGEFDDAIQAMQRAQMIRVSQLEEKKPDNPKLKRDLGMGYYNLATVRQELGNSNRAETHYLQAVKVFSELQIAQPNSIDYNRFLAACQRMLGDLLKESDPEKSIDYYRRSQKVLESSRSQNPNVVDIAADLSGLYLNLGDLLHSQGKLDDALDVLDRSIKVLEDLSEDLTDVPWYRLDLGRAQRSVGVILAEAGRPEEAKGQLETSRTTLSKLVSEDLSNEEFTIELALTMDAIAELESLDKQSEEPTE